MHHEVTLFFALLLSLVIFLKSLDMCFVFPVMLIGASNPFFSVLALFFPFCGQSGDPLFVGEIVILVIQPQTLLDFIWGLWSLVGHFAALVGP
jgi:hypothetical protein